MSRDEEAPVVLVTGGARGIGSAICGGLVRRGARVVIGCRDLAAGRAIAAELDGGPGAARPVRLDVTEPAEIAAAVADIDAKEGRLDALVHNAAVITEWDLVRDGTDDPARTAARLRTTFDVNVVGPMTLTGACLDLLARSVGRRPGPVVVHLTSALGSMTHLGDPDHSAARRAVPGYIASKAAMSAVTLMWASRFADLGIRVNAVSPGLTPTGLNEASPYPRGERTLEEAAEVPIAVALGLPLVDGDRRSDTADATGMFFGRDGGGLTLPW